MVEVITSYSHVIYERERERENPRSLNINFQGKQDCTT